MRHVTTELCKFQCHLQLHTNRTHTAKKKHMDERIQSQLAGKMGEKMLIISLDEGLSIKCRAMQNADVSQ